MHDAVTEHVPAPPAAVWSIVSDITNTGKLSPETFEAEWLDGATGPEVGVRFRGHVRRGGYGPVYWTVCRITDCEPGRSFGFDVVVGDRVINSWHYAFEPQDGGTAVTESFRLATTPLTRAYWAVAGWRRRPYNRENMRATLRRLRAVAEEVPTTTTPVPFDPELAAVLPTVNAAIPPGIRPDGIAGLRAVTGARIASDDDLRRDGRIAVREVELSAGATLLVCTPTGLAATAPAIYHVHGGGMVSGSARGSSIVELLDQAEALGVVVVAVDYRLAPEHPYPAGVDDCTAGLAWTVDHAAELGIDPTRLVLAGFSAGGGLAAAVALRARAVGGPALRGLMLASPMLDDRNETASGRQMAGLGLWDRTANETGWTALLGDRRGGTDVPEDAAPARASDLSGLPPTFLDVGSAETFRDETVAFASRLWAAGARAELHVWPGGFHAFDAMVPAAAVSQDARTARVDWLRRVL